MPPVPAAVGTVAKRAPLPMQLYASKQERQLELLNMYEKTFAKTAEKLELTNFTSADMTFP